MTDAPILNVNGRDLDTLKVAMGLARKDKAAGYCIDTENSIPRMVLFWVDNERMSAFPSRLTMDRCADIAFDWLASDGCTYPAEPSHDGSNKPGWYIYTDSWGHIDGFGFESFLAIEPHWMLYGK